MDFAQHLVSYYKGEWLEAVLLTAFGITTTGLALVLWQQSGQNSLVKGLFYPMAFLAAFTLLAGGFQVRSNGQRLATMPAQYAQSQAAFVQAERNRFEGTKGVNAWWMPLKTLWAVLTIAGIAVSFTTRNGFAHHRAKAYTAALSSQSAVQP